MPLTVGQVATLPELGLVVRTASAALDREVRWVAVSELVDPTPWIEPGDLLLTTGMALVDRAPDARAYVRRLVAADVAGLGFGVGLTHGSVPSTLVAAAEKAGLPVLEVPQPVPFVAVSKAVSRLLTVEEYADAAASFECQRRLIRAALGDPGDATGAEVVRVLAGHVHGFALRVDAAGHVLAAHPSAAADRLGDLAGEIDRLRPRGLLASSALATADEHVVILPIGVKGAAEGFLVVGSPRPLRSADQAVINLAVSLLSWSAHRPIVEDAGMDPWRRLLLREARRSGLDRAVLADVGLAGLDPRRAVAFEVRGAVGHPVPEAALARTLRSRAVLACRADDGSAVGVAAVDPQGDLPAEVSALAEAPGIGAVGVSVILDLTDPGNVRQAREQAATAARGRGLCRYGDEPSRGLSSLLDAATVTAWATGYLGDLPASGEGRELMDTIAAWLDQHGQVDAAAQRLGVHRHTVRHRLRRAEAVLGRDLDDPAVRADLWFALAAVRRTGPDGGSPVPSGA